MNSDTKKLFQCIQLLRSKRVDLYELDKAFVWAEDFLSRIGPRLYAKRLVLAELDPLESLAVALGVGWLENCHDRWYSEDKHNCHHGLIERLKKCDFLDERYWESLTRSTHMFPNAVFADKDVMRDWLGLAVSFWTSEDQEEAKDPEAAKITMRQGIRFFRYYYYIAGLSWSADRDLSDRFVPADSPVVATIEKAFDSLILEGRASDTGVADTLSGMACPIGATELRNLKFPTRMVRPSVDQLIAQDQRESATIARKQDPTKHWAQMNERTRDAWRLACLALKVEQGSADTFFSFYEKYVVRWHEWESVECQQKLHFLPKDSNPHPRICHIGTGWLVTGVFEKKRWTVVTRRFAHAASVWIQAIAGLHKGMLETGDRLNEAFFKPLALQLPRVNPRRSTQQPRPLLSQSE
jgi:hypothetical protein